VDSPEQAAAVLRARRALGLEHGIVLANPVAAAEALDPFLHDRVLRSGLAAAEAAGIRGKDVTPFLLDWFHRETGGQSLRTNVSLVLANARLAAEVAVAAARP
jgi:pseudouridine-5'-phosphate glycosidase